MTPPRLAVPLLLALSAAAAEFPKLINTELDLSVPLPSAAAATAAMKAPPGFDVTLFAAEPAVQNPVALSWDDRGRLWIAENFTYAERAVRFDLSLRDRVLILEDRDGDGRADSRRVFTDEVQMLTSLAVGHGGVWLMCPPHLKFIPDRNADGVPDGPAELVLDGFNVARENYHNFANGLKWGPDGWLYGRCGHSCPGLVGAPGTPDAARVPLEGGIWRYHPQRRVFESLNSGTTNPWGHDWDRHGELFFINTVVGHLWHGIPGAHYRRSTSLTSNPHIYSVIDQHADHYHFDTGKGWTASRGGTANDLGGGHAHIGMVIYQGDNWPAAWRDKLFTVNQHGRRLNVERLERSGSGYVGRHEPDFLLAGDPWFRGLDLSTGPNGGVFLIDWSDTGECHDNTGVHRESGRIFKITHRDAPRTPTAPADLSPLDSAALADLHCHTNEWQVRAARLLLSERARAGADLSASHPRLRALLASTDTTHRLRALWTLRLTGGCDDATLRALLRDPDEHLRTWAIRLLTDTWPLDHRTAVRPAAPEAAPPTALLGEFAQVAATDPSGLVRLTLASTVQRLPLVSRPALAAALAARASDATDHNLPPLVWFGLVPVAAAEPAALLPVATASTWPDLNRWIARRLAEDLTTRPAPLDALLSALATAPTASLAATLQGLTEALAGWRKAPRPSSWDAFSARLANATDPAVLARLRDLSALFGDGRALDEVKRVALDDKAELPAREAALRTLIESRPPDLRAVCEKLLDVRFLNAIAARGLALFDDPAIGVKLARAYRRFAPASRPAILDTLVTRPAFAHALLDQIGDARIPRYEVTAFHARQIRAFNDPALTQKLTDTWGELRDSAADKTKLIADLKAKLTPAALARADLAQGRVLAATCTACHTLYGEGGKIGPDLTGSGRANLDYLLENIIDPSAVVAPDYRVTLVTLKDGRVLSGALAVQTARTLTLRQMTEPIVLERSEILKQETSPLSLMPEGLLQSYNDTRVRDLIAYLMHPTQVPLPP